MAAGGGVDVGYFAIPIIPSFEGIEAKINAGFGGKFGAAGTKSGKEFSTALAGGINAGETQVASALKKHETLLAKQADAIGKVRVEQAKLNDLQKAGATDTRLLAQTERFETAKRKEALAIKAAADAHTLYDRAQRQNQRTAQAMGADAKGGLFGNMTNGAERLVTALRESTSQMGPLGATAANVGGGFQSMGSSMLSTATSAGLMGVGIGAGVMALTKVLEIGPEVVGKLYEIGASFNEMGNVVSFKTGATGGNLAALTDTVKTVAKGTSSSVGQIGVITADVVRSLHLTGAELTTVTTSITNLNERTGEATNIRDLGKAFRGFGVDAKDQNDALNQLYTASTKTGQSVNDLIHNVTVGGAPLRELGLDFGKSAALMTSFENAGLDGTKMVTGLRKSVAEFAKEHKDIPKALQESVTQLHDFAEAAKKGDTAADDMGVTLANKLFGSKTGIQFWDAVKSGNLDLQSLAGSMDTTTLSITDMADQTESASQKWEKLKNNIEVAVQPIATKVFDIAQSGLTDLTAWVTNHQSDLINFFTNLGVAGIESFRGIAAVLGPTLTALGNTVGLLKTVSDWTGIGSVIDLGTVPQDIAATGDALSHIAGQAGTDAEAKLRAFGNAAADASKLTQSLGTAVATVPDGKTIVIKDNTPEAEEKLKKLGFDVEHLPDGTVKLVPQTDEARRIFEAFLAEKRQAEVEVVFKDPTGKPIDPGQLVAPSTVGVGGGRATGGIYDVWNEVAAFARGGLPNMATIQQPVGGAGLIQWAEPSTHGEAFIPLAPGNRARSLAIWEEVGRRLGVMDTGGIRPSGAVDPNIDPNQQIGIGNFPFPRRNLWWGGKDGIPPMAGPNAQIPDWLWGTGGSKPFPNITGGEWPDPNFPLPGSPGWIARHNRRGIKGFDTGGILTPDMVKAIAAQYGLSETSGFRDEKGSYHATGEAGDFGNGDKTDAEYGFAQYLATNYGSQITELIHEDPRFSSNIKDGSAVGPFGKFYTMAQAGYHGDHVHIALKRPAGTDMSQWSFGTPNQPLGNPANQAALAGHTAANTANLSPQDQGAAAIIAEGQRRGYSSDQIQMVLADSIGESSLNSSIVNASGHKGLFQQDSGYPGRDTLQGQVTGFYDRLDAQKGGDIGSRIAGVEKGGYGGDWVAQFMPQAQGYYNRLAGNAAHGAQGPGGQPGHYEPDPKAVETARQGVADAESKIAIAEQKVRELKADAKESERMTLEHDVEKAKADKTKADEALATAQQGKFVADPKQATANSAGTTGGKQSPFGGAGDPMQIAMGGILQTFGLDGSWLPDIKNLGIVKLLGAIMNIKYTPVGDGKFTGGLLAGVDNPLAAGGGGGGGGGDPLAGLLGLPFGMIPNATAPGPPSLAPAGAPASGQGSGPPPGPVDQSTNININNPQGDANSIAQVTRRTLLNTPRLDTYVPAGTQ